MIVVQKVLVIGISVYRFYMSFDNIEIFMNYIQSGNNGIGRTGCSRPNVMVIRIVIQMVDAVNNIGYITAGGSCKSTLDIPFDFKCLAKDLSSLNTPVLSINKASLMPN